VSALLRLNARVWPALTLALLAAITILSLAPGPELQASLAGGDKLQHIVAYAALALPVGLARPRGRLALLVGLGAWSGALELIQPLAERHASPADFTANVAGVALGGLAAGWLRWLTGAQP
jgi:hypothetical protein